MSPRHTAGRRYRARGQDLIAKQAVEAGGGTPADAAAFVKLELETWARRRLMTLCAAGHRAV